MADIGSELLHWLADKVLRLLLRLLELFTPEQMESIPLSFKCLAGGCLAVGVAALVGGIRSGLVFWYQIAAWSLLAAISLVCVGVVRSRAFPAR